MIIAVCYYSVVTPKKLYSYKQYDNEYPNIKNAILNNWLLLD
jgi:hypothetical protein